MQVGYEKSLFSTDVSLTGKVSSVVNKLRPWTMLTTASVGPLP